MMADKVVCSAFEAVKPLFISEMSRAQLDEELRKGVESARRGTTPARKAEQIIRQELGL